MTTPPIRGRSESAPYRRYASGKARPDHLVPGGRVDQHGQHSVPVYLRQPAVQLVACVLADGPVDDHRADPVGEVMVQEVGRIHHRHERARSRAIGSVGFGVHVVENDPVDLHRPEAGQGRGGAAAGLVGGAGQSWWGQAVEQYAVPGAGQQLDGRRGLGGNHRSIMSGRTATV